MEIRLVEKPAFSVVGREGSGEPGGAWIRALWDDANSHFAEIFPIIAKDRLGKAQVWGLMSDAGRSFLPWDERGGLYLAGCEVRPGASVPDGWTKWDVPAYLYAVAEYTEGTYNEVFCEVTEDWLPKNGHTLAGAVHEFYPTSGALELWFAIKKL